MDKRVYRGFIISKLTLIKKRWEKKKVGEAQESTSESHL